MRCVGGSVGSWCRKMWLSIVVLGMVLGMVAQVGHVASGTSIVLVTGPAQRR